MPAGAQPSKTHRRCSGDPGRAEAVTAEAGRRCASPRQLEVACCLRWRIWEHAAFLGDRGAAGPPPSLDGAPKVAGEAKVQAGPQVALWQAAAAAARQAAVAATVVQAAIGGRSRRGRSKRVPQLPAQPDGRRACALRGVREGGGNKERCGRCTGSSAQDNAVVLQPQGLTTASQAGASMLHQHCVKQRHALCGTVSHLKQKSTSLMVACCPVAPAAPAAAAASARPAAASARAAACAPGSSAQAAWVGGAHSHCAGSRGLARRSPIDCSCKRKNRLHVRHGSARTMALPAFKVQHEGSLASLRWAPTSRTCQRQGGQPDQRIDGGGAVLREVAGVARYQAGSQATAAIGACRRVGREQSHTGWTVADREQRASRRGCA